MVLLTEPRLVEEFVVAVLFVRADCRGVAGPVWAEWALVRSLPSVGSYVTLKVIARATTVVAIRAEVRPLSSVCSQVQLKLVTSAAHFATQRTRYLGFARHDPHPAQLLQPLAAL